MHVQLYRLAIGAYAAKGSTSACADNPVIELPFIRALYTLR